MIAGAAERRAALVEKLRLAGWIFSAHELREGGSPLAIAHKMKTAGLGWDPEDQACVVALRALAAEEGASS